MRKEKRLKAKIVSALLVLTVAFTMAGCNNNNNSKKSEETKPKTESTQVKATIAKVKFKPESAACLRVTSVNCSSVVGSAPVLCTLSLKSP